MRERVEKTKAAAGHIGAEEERPVAGIPPAPRTPGIAGGFARSDKRSTMASGGALVVLFHPRLEETLDLVTRSGGRITQAIFSYPGGRRFHFTEPSGNELSVCSEA